MDLKRRKRLSLLILVLGLPAYIMVTWLLLGWLSDKFGRLPFLVELLVFVLLGVLWALPFKRVFKGIGKE